MTGIEVRFERYELIRGVTSAAVLQTLIEDVNLKLGLSSGAQDNITVFHLLEAANFRK